MSCMGYLHPPSLFRFQPGASSRSDLSGGHADPRPPGGLMVPFLGRRFTVEELGEHENAEGMDEKLPWVRAYEIPCLIGRRLMARQPALPKALQDLLAACCPGIDWGETPRDFHMALQKYGILHTYVSAPEDGASGEPMGIEIYGQVIAMDGTALDPGWAAERMHRRIDSLGGLQAPETRRYFEFDVLWPPLEGELTIAIEAAVYANVSDPSVGMPFYL